MLDRHSLPGGRHIGPVNAVQALTLCLLLVNTIVLLSDHSWITDRFGSSTGPCQQHEAAGAADDIIAVPTSAPRITLSPASQQHQALPADLLELFPQAALCGTNSHIQQYADMHKRTLADKDSFRARYLVSVAPQTGTADRLVGMVTEFWLAFLSNRAFTAYVPQPDRIPDFRAACDQPLFNWTHPDLLDDELLEPLAVWHNPKSSRAPDEAYPPPYDAHYLMHNWNNGTTELLEWLQYQNLTAYPADRPRITYIISSSNRGASYKMLHNPFHRNQFWQMGLRPQDGFMCGFFYLCAPNTAVRRLYQQSFWQPLQQPGVLKIGIQVRFGDRMMMAGSSTYTPLLMNLAAPYFECATRIEQAFAAPGQKVIWYLLSDAAALRRAAKDKFGDKLLTDTGLEILHTDCKRNSNTSACSTSVMDDALRHSVGSILSFSLCDFHVITSVSGFGRTGAWLSGKWSNLYEVKFGDSKGCNPWYPTTPETSSAHWSGV